MKKCAIGVALLAVAISLGAAPPQSGGIELVVGTYRDGNNVTEPRPAESRYFRTKIAGFQIIQGFAGYKVFIDVIERPKKRAYTRITFENPAEPKKPFVYEHYVDPDTPMITLTHGPAKRLKIYKDYRVEVILFADEARTQEIDRLVQKVRSYVDTTGQNLKLFGGLKTKLSDGLTERLAQPPSKK